MNNKGIDSADYFNFMTAGSNTAVNNTPPPPLEILTSTILYVFENL